MATRNSKFDGEDRRETTPLGPVKVVVGWQVSRRLDQTFLAVPVFTIKHG